MIKIKTKQEIIKMRHSGHILAKVFSKIIPEVKTGISTEELDQKIEKTIASYGAQPSFKNYQGYRHASCLSINEDVVHGVPSKRKICQGDILGVDIGVCHQGYHADATQTVIIGNVPANTRKLVQVTKRALHLAIKKIKPGIKLSVIQAIIQNQAKENGFQIIKNLSGHGIGKSLQEPPIIYNYVQSNNSLILKEGMCFCLEPMFSLGSQDIKIKQDNWTTTTLDDSLSAHFEDTVLVTKKGYEILTQL